MNQVINFSERKIKKYQKVVADKNMVDVLESLRQYVENIGTGKICLVNGIYQQQDIGAVQTTRVGAWVFGYQIKPTIDPGIYKRFVYLKLPGEKILDVPEQDRNPIMAAIFQTMVDTGNEFPNFDLVANDCILMTQRFSVMFWHEKNPNVVTP